MVMMMMKEKKKKKKKRSTAFLVFCQARQAARLVRHALEVNCIPLPLNEGSAGCMTREVHMRHWTSPSFKNPLRNHRHQRERKGGRRGALELFEGALVGF